MPSLEVFAFLPFKIALKVWLEREFEEEISVALQDCGFSLLFGRLGMFCRKIFVGCYLSFIEGAG